MSKGISYKKGMFQEKIITHVENRYRIYTLLIFILIGLLYSEICFQNIILKKLIKTVLNYAQICK